MLKGTMFNPRLIFDLKENTVFISYESMYSCKLIWMQIFNILTIFEVDFCFLCSVNHFYHIEIDQVPLLN